MYVNYSIVECVTYIEAMLFVNLLKIAVLSSVIAEYSSHVKGDDNNYESAGSRDQWFISLYFLKMLGPISQNGNFYSDDASSPKISWFQISFKSVQRFGYKKR